MQELNTENVSIVANLVIEIERVELNVEPEVKGKTLGCWGPSPDDHRSQC